MKKALYKFYLKYCGVFFIEENENETLIKWAPLWVAVCLEILFPNTYQWVDKETVNITLD